MGYRKVGWLEQIWYVFKGLMKRKWEWYLERRMTMADLKECRKYECCGWRKSVGYCPENCNHFKHRNEVVVVPCRECKHWRSSGNNIFGPDYGTCVECLMDTKNDFYCGYGERRTDGN